jgi:YggT family protein
MLALTKIILLLVDVAVGILAGACLLRLFMQYQRIPFGNPIGRFIFALTDWLVLPLRKVLPGKRKIDLASLVAAYLLVLVECLVIHLLLAGGHLVHLVPVVAVFATLRIVLYGLMAMVIVYAVLSWFNPDSPMYDLIDRLCSPALRPFRRMIPLVGGVDLSPLVLIVLLQIAMILLRSVVEALRLPFFFS